MMIGINMKKQIIFLTILICSLLSFGCDGSDGALSDPVGPVSYVVPTIQNLNVTSTQVSRSEGGILGFTCEWTSPGKIGTAAAYLAFVRTIYNPVTGPVGVIGSATATASANILDFPIVAATATDTATCTTDLVAFYSRFKDPIYIPTKVGTDELGGGWSVAIPFTPDDVCDAPEGKQQMLFWMQMNGLKTNTLAFEMEFTP